MAHSQPHNKPNILVIDTSGPRLQLGLRASGSAENVSLELATGHAERIFDEIAALLKRNAVDYDDLNRLGVSTGPGSFTGLRIGIAAARGLGLALKLPVIGVPNLLALSLAAQPDKPVDIVLDARRSQAYAQSFVGPGVPENQPELISLEDAQNNYPRSRVALISDPKIDVALLLDFCAKADPDNFPPAPTYVRAADAKPQTKGKIEIIDAQLVAAPEQTT